MLSEYWVAVIVICVALTVLLLGIVCFLSLCLYRRRRSKSDGHMIPVGNHVQLGDTALMATHVSVGPGVLLNTSDNAASVNVVVTGDDIYSDENTVRVWLNSMGLVQYFDAFIDNGFGEHMRTLSTLSDEDLVDLGISDLEHRQPDIDAAGQWRESKEKREQ